MDEKILSSYHAWCAHASADPDLARELAAMAQDEAALSDAFYRDLAFGTGGLRGVIGAGTNRMNVYTVAKASQGLANYVVRLRRAASPSAMIHASSPTCLRAWLRAYLP